MKTGLAFEAGKSSDNKRADIHSRICESQNSSEPAEFANQFVGVFSPRGKAADGLPQTSQDLNVAPVTVCLPTSPDVPANVVLKFFHPTRHHYLLRPAVPPKA